MQQMICTGLARYAGKELKKGQKFDVEDEHVRTLEVTRKAKKVPGKPADQKQEGEGAKGGSYSTREMTAGAESGSTK